VALTDPATVVLSPWEAAAREFEPKQLAPRRWATPGMMAQALERGTRQTPALEAIDRELVDVADGRTERLQIFMAPQEGKSRRVSCWYPLWRLAEDPTLRIAIVSYSAKKALRWGRWLRRHIRDHPELGIGLMRDSRAADMFETTAGGQVLCVGIDGGITGEPVDELIIDDPVRGRAEAESATYRDAAWDWWESNGATRLSSRGRVILMMTRWHADDLAGRLMANEPGEWRVLRIPAIRQEQIDVRGSDGASAYDPSGELISVQGRRPGHFHALKAKRSAYVWRSIYDQDPTSAEGNLFRRPDFRYWHPMPADPSRHGPTAGRRVDLAGRTVMLDDCWRFVTVDLAASKKTSADWTVAAVWAITPDGDLVLLDRARARLEEGGHFGLVGPCCDRWAAPDVFVERGFIGTTLVIDATRAGLRVQPVDPDTDKVTRALPATHRVTAHRAWFPAGVDWLDEWCDELAEFPTGAHDDQVDCFAYAARITSAHWLPAEAAEQTLAARQHTDAVGPVADAYAAATGHSPNGINFETVAY
jgi:predicted phage terminase large subunit-like protein